MTTLVEDLLLLARLDAGRPMSREPVDLTRLLVEAVSDARVLVARPPLAHRRAGRADRGGRRRAGAAPGRHQPADQRPQAHARRHHGHRDRPRRTASTSTTTVPASPTTSSDHAFERFARGDVSRNRAGGAGLGLSLVEAIVRSHVGTVGLRSEPGDTTVEVRLGTDGDCLTIWAGMTTYRG